MVDYDLRRIVRFLVGASGILRSPPDREPHHHSTVQLDVCAILSQTSMQNSLSILGFLKHRQRPPPTPARPQAPPSPPP